MNDANIKEKNMKEREQAFLYPKDWPVDGGHISRYIYIYIYLLSLPLRNLPPTRQASIYLRAGSRAQAITTT